MEVETVLPGFTRRIPSAVIFTVVPSGAVADSEVDVPATVTVILESVFETFTSDFLPLT